MLIQGHGFVKDKDLIQGQGQGWVQGQVWGQSQGHKSLSNMYHKLKKVVISPKSNRPKYTMLSSPNIHDSSALSKQSVSDQSVTPEKIIQAQT